MEGFCWREKGGGVDGVAGVRIKVDHGDNNGS